MPKVELHCHLEGSVPAATAIDLARRNGVRLPTTDPDRLYEMEDLEEFLVVYRAVSAAMVTPGDFARVAYDALADGARTGNLRYREMAFNPTNHPDLAYPDMLAGLTEGLRAAEADFGVGCRLIVAINREHGPATATELVREVAATPSEYVVGVGLDHNERLGPPELFAEAYALAARVGLHRTAHAGERGNAAEIRSSIDVLGVERIDHGYAVLADPALTADSRARGVHYATCWQTALFHVGGDLGRSPIGAMIEAGLDVSVSSDDPPMMHTDIGAEYAAAGDRLGWTVDQAEVRVLAAVDAAFLDPGGVAALRAQLGAELAEFRTRRLPDGPALSPAGPTPAGWSGR